MCVSLCVVRSGSSSDVAFEKHRSLSACRLTETGRTQDLGRFKKRGYLVSSRFKRFFEALSSLPIVVSLILVSSTFGVSRAVEH